MLKVYNPKS